MTDTAENDPYFSVPEKSNGTDSKPSESDASSSVGEKKTASSSVTTPKASMSKPSSATTEAKAFSLEEANEEIALLLQSHKVTQKEVSALQGMMRDHVALREKVSKLKSLLGRSAKAQRESKMELESTAKKLDQAVREIERLTKKVDHLANRPTHMDLLADFETNFDKALLTVGSTQSGGQDTSATPAIIPPTQQDAVVDSMLLQELAEAQTRVERLEALNGALLQKSSQLEGQTNELQHEKDLAEQHLARVQLELRMAQMEAENAARAVQDKTQSLQEMQLEIDLVTKASMDANVRAKQGEEAARSVQTDREKVQQLQAQVQALQEWALASAEAKRLFQDRVRLLEAKIKAMEKVDNEMTNPNGERILTTKTSSLVIGAGDTGFVILELGEHAQALRDNERFVLRWRFDVTPVELNIEYSILKGVCDNPQKRFFADSIIKDRLVTGGAGGENEAVFAVQNSCTLLWSNEKSWVRPRTIKYYVDILAVKDSD